MINSIYTNLFSGVEYSEEWPASEVYLDKALSFLKDQGFIFPRGVDVSFANMPGNCSSERSGACSERIVFDVSEPFSMNTVVHELTHVATSWLVAVGGANLYLAEGLAIWMANKYDGAQRTPSRSINQPNIDLDDFEKSFPEQPSSLIREGLSYGFSYRVITHIIDTVGEQALIDMVVAMESQPLDFYIGRPSIEGVDEIVQEYTGKTADEWCEEVYDAMPVDNYHTGSEIHFELGFSPKRSHLHSSLGLHRIGRYLRAMGSIGFGDLRNEEGEAVEFYTALGYDLRLAPLLPWMTWKSKGFRFMELGLETGIMFEADLDTGKYEQVRVQPYARGTLDVISAGFGIEDIWDVRLAVGGAVLVSPDTIIPEVQSGLTISF